MPMATVQWPYEVQDKIAELEKAGNRVAQVVHLGDRWAILYHKGPGRPPAGKEIRG